MKKILLFLSVVLVTQTHGQIISTVAGNGTLGFSGNGGQATAAELYHPDYSVLDALGNLYITDVYNNVIRKVDTLGIITTVVGNGTPGHSGDGGPATSAQLSHPYYIAFDAFNNLYVSDYDCVRKVTPSGIITTVAGNGISGFSGDGGLATSAQLSNCVGITISSNGNLYIADAGNNRIRMVNTAGIISTIAGNGTFGFSGDGGQATSAELWDPTEVILDANNNLYISDTYNHRIRKVNPSGIITTVVGNGTMGFSGDGGQATLAELHYPSGIVLDGAGNLYIADHWNHRVRKVDASGIITTIAGNGTFGFSGDGGPATAAELYSPEGLSFDAHGNLYISEWDNDRVRKVTNIASGIEQLSLGIESKIFPNPTSDQFLISLNTTEKLIVNIYDVDGRLVFTVDAMDKSNINVTGLKEGVYNLVIKTADRIINKKLVVVR